MVNDTQDAADRCALGAYPRRGSGRSHRPRRAHAVARATAVLTGHGPWRTASPGSRPGRATRPTSRRGAVGNRASSPSLYVVARNPSRKNAHGFFLARWGEVLGSRKKLQGKDLQKQKRCGLLECSCEDVRSSLAGGKR